MSYFTAENDWRLAQYLIKYKQSPSFSSSSSSPNMSNEGSITDACSVPIQHEESNISAQSLALLLPQNSNELSSHSDDDNNLTPYDRLQECLRPITDMATSDITFSYGY